MDQNELDNSPNLESNVTPEKMIPQSQVNEIVKQAKAKVKASMEQELKSSQSYSMPDASNTGTSSGLTPQQVQALIEQELQNKAKQWEDSVKTQQAESTAYDFYGKLNQAKDSHSDYLEVIGSLPFGEIPHIVAAANQMDNCAEIMYELAKNPQKLASLYNLSSPGMRPSLEASLKAINDSIKINNQAKEAKSPNSPLSQIKPSPISTGNGSMSVSDFRKIFKA